MSDAIDLDMLEDSAWLRATGASQRERLGYPQELFFLREPLRPGHVLHVVVTDLVRTREFAYIQAPETDHDRAVAAARKAQEDARWAERDEIERIGRTLDPEFEALHATLQPPHKGMTDQAQLDRLLELIRAAHAIGMRQPRPKLERPGFEDDRIPRATLSINPVHKKARWIGETLKAAGQAFYVYEAGRPSNTLRIDVDAVAGVNGTRRAKYEAARIGNAYAVMMGLRLQK